MRAIVISEHGGPEVLKVADTSMRGGGRSFGISVDAKPKRVFGFEQVVDADRLMDAGEAGGKLVVEVG
jgi:hypothetical protein